MSDHPPTVTPDATGRRRIGIFGGSFDPIHNAHLALARLALRDLALDELRWVPAGQPWQKTRRLAPAADREAMVRLAIADEPRFRLTCSELLRDGPSYAIDTVEQLQASEPGADWFLLMGLDQYAGFHTWHRWQDLLQRVTLAVAGRPGATRSADPRVAREPHVALDLPSMPVSSTAIRERLAADRNIAGLAGIAGIADLVPAAVASYIERHRLYQPPPGNPARS